MELLFDESWVPAEGFSFCSICSNYEVLLASSYRMPCCEVSLCRDCLRSYIRYRIEDGQHLFPCPGCDQKLKEEVVNLFSTESEKNRVELLRITAENSKTKRSCPNCTHIKSISDETYRLMKKAKSSTRQSDKVNKIVCDSCDKAWCYFCYGPTHAGISCNDNQDDNSQFNQWSKNWDGENQQQNAFRCPKCRIPTQRAGGCPSMTCKNCSFDWCYTCGKAIYSNHILFGSHSGDKWQVNACDGTTIFGSKKASKRWRWFKLVQEFIVISICGIAIITVCFPLLPVLVFVVPPILWMIYSGKKSND